MEWYFDIRTCIRWFLVGLSAVSTVCMVYYFVKIFVKKRVYVCCIVALLTALCLFWYFSTRYKPSVIYMQEDVLYIKPSDDIE